MRKLLIVAAALTAIFSGEVSAAKYTSTSTITYNGIKYQFSSSSTCIDGTAALRMNRKWWCPVTTTTSVTAPKTYNASLSWTVPSTRADGTPLSVSEVSGYEVYYTNDSGSVSISLPISGGSTASAVVNNLASGNYYFSISAIDTAGLKSALSTVASITVP